ncbi:TetR/AcrR family transcriptional regulator [Mucilaginibacter phyllosphaerae]
MVKIEKSKAERTKAFIIERSAALFNCKGYTDTSLADIMGATGLSKGCIYGNFENKEEIALAAFEYSFQKMSQQFEIQVSFAKTHRARIIAYAKVYEMFTKHHIETSRCLKLSTATEANNRRLKTITAGNLEKWQQKLQEIMEEGIAAGEFKKDAAVTQTAVSIISLLEGGLMIAQLTGDPLSMNFVLASIDILVSRLE